MGNLPDTLILFCRPGFESDCGNELTDHAARKGSFGYFRPGHIVDKPRRTAELAARWVAGQHCRYTIFNLKLPMKRRYEEWLACRELIGERLQAAEVPFRLSARHLYHDREEITCFLERLDG
jgi:23S rRNA C2498 (ribose-2'-O)-methylase RlmM